MEYGEWFPQRLSALRLQKGVSARDMSLSLGQSESYINKIENRRTMPSMMGFFYICEYLEITPQEFFEFETASPSTTKKLVNEFGKLETHQAEHILSIIEDLNKNKHYPPPLRL